MRWCATTHRQQHAHRLGASALIVDGLEHLEDTPLVSTPAMFVPQLQPQRNPSNYSPGDVCLYPIERAGNRRHGWVRPKGRCAEIFSPTSDRLKGPCPWSTATPLVSQWCLARSPLLEMPSLGIFQEPSPPQQTVLYHASTIVIPASPTCFPIRPHGSPLTLSAVPSLPSVPPSRYYYYYYHW
jgi:hypothetical protein